MFAPALCLGALIHVLHGAVLVLFIVVSLLMTLVILMQEGKGGGLAGAFGGAGAETFGVKAGTVNRFTAWLAAGFLGLALIYAGMAMEISRRDRAGAAAPAIDQLRPQGSPAGTPAGDGQAPAGDGSQPAGDGSQPAGDGAPPANGSGEGGGAKDGAGQDEAGPDDAGSKEAPGDGPKETPEDGASR